MALSTILMIIGILFIILSFFLKDPAKKIEQDVEELSISIFQETNALKRRMKIVEEELMLEPDFQVKSPTTSQLNNFQQIQAQYKSQQTAASQKPIHEIIISQVLELNKQGLAIPDISLRSNLTEQQVRQVLTTRGGR